MHCLERARDLLASAAPAGAPGTVLGTRNLPDPAEMVRGWCLHDLGRPGPAAEVIAAQRRLVPDGALRTQARYGARQALAHAAAGEVEQACALAEELLPAFHAVDSATVAADLRRLARTLARRPGNAAARALLPLLTTAPRLQRTAREHRPEGPDRA